MINTKMKLREPKKFYKKLSIKVDKLSSAFVRWSLVKLDPVINQLCLMIDLGDDMPNDDKAQIAKSVLVATPIVIVLLMSILVIGG